MIFEGISRILDLENPGTNVMNIRVMAALSKMSSWQKKQGLNLRAVWTGSGAILPESFPQDAPVTSTTWRNWITSRGLSHHQNHQRGEGLMVSLRHRDRYWDDSCLRFTMEMVIPSRKLTYPVYHIPSHCSYVYGNAIAVMLMGILI